MEKREKRFEKLYIGIVFVLLFIWSVSARAATGPDETMKYDVCRYIAVNGRLPHGGDPSIRHGIWGTSYGFTPLLSYIVSAVFLKIANLFTEDAHILYIALRFTSVLCITGMTALVIRIGHLLFEKRNSRWLFILLATLLPQVLYLGSYLNNDSFALFTISIIIYAWIKGIRSQWNVQSCILLAVGIGLCALSYYNAYGYILCSIPLFFLSWQKTQKGGTAVENRKADMTRMWKMAGLIAGIAFLIAGWWFIRNAVIYQGDFLGLKTSNEYAEKYAQTDFKPSLRPNPNHLGWSFYEMLISNCWLKVSMTSFVGLLGTEGLPMLGKVYRAIWAVILLGYAGMVVRMIKREKPRESRLFSVIFSLSIVIPILLSFYHSYWIDFQPQGRYLMPMLIPFMYFSVTGLEYLFEKLPTKVKWIPYMVIDAGIAISALICLKEVQAVI